MTENEQAIAVVVGLRDVRAWRWIKGMPNYIWIVDNGTGTWWKEHTNGDMELHIRFDGNPGNPCDENMVEVEVPSWYTA